MATEKMTKNTVFNISLLLTGGIALWAVGFNDSFTVVSNAIYTFLTKQFGWLYLVAMLFFVFFVDRAFKGASNNFYLKNLENGVRLTRPSQLPRDRTVS